MKLRTVALSLMLTVMELSVASSSWAIVSYQNFFDALGSNESNGNYTAENQLDFLGKYQVGEGILHDLGYYNSTTGYYPTNGASKNTWQGTWPTIGSKQNFLNSPATQELVIRQEAGLNWFRLNYFLTADINPNIDINATNYNLINQYLGQPITYTLNGQSNTVTITRSGLIAAAHLVGPGSVAQFLDGTNKAVPADENGTPITDYIQDKSVVISSGRKGLGGYATPFDTLYDPSQNLSLLETGTYGTYNYSEINSFPFFTVTQVSNSISVPEHSSALLDTLAVSVLGAAYVLKRK